MADMYHEYELFLPVPLGVAGPIYYAVIMISRGPASSVSPDALPSAGFCFFADSARVMGNLTIFPISRRCAWTQEGGFQAFVP
jgi:hypothetical protein